jgi:hypothetical protein
MYKYLKGVHEKESRSERRKEGMVPRRRLHSIPSRYTKISRTNGAYLPLSFCCPGVTRPLLRDSKI